ncbi:MAG: D-TA family PLP-dependent enzyme [Chitinophagaceae bacterium]|nr:D-TA family PLP-dependent enzyme [Chitinophagaceae bacterium]
MASSNHEWYELRNADQLDSPALILFPNRVKENIRMLISMIDDVQRLRPHVKTNKSSEACKLMMDAGISKFKCATISEAEMLASCGATDVLLAYQPVGPKLKRFAELIRTFTGTIFSCLIDHPHAAAQMDFFFSSNNLRIPVYIDLNTGMNRTGIAPGLECIQLYADYVDGGGIFTVGLHVYDGHVRNIDFERRKQECDETFAAVIKMREALIEKMFPEPIIVAGGTPTFSIHCKRKDIECSPGTFIYWDKGYQDLCKEQPFLPAALVISRIISIPDKNKICIDLGHKSIASEGELSRRVHFLNAGGLQFIGHSEEHLVAQIPDGHAFQTGDLLYGLPFHICPTVALYERAYTIENGTVTGEWKNVARDRKISL